MIWEEQKIEQQLKDKLISELTATQAEDVYKEYVDARNYLLKNIYPEIKKREPDLSYHDASHIANVLQNIHELTPQEARSVLPNSLKTEIVMTMNLREWRHFFKLRTSSAAHPQMLEIARPMLDEFKRLIPVVFDDITY